MFFPFLVPVLDIFIAGKQSLTPDSKTQNHSFPCQVFVMFSYVLLSPQPVIPLLKNCQPAKFYKVMWIIFLICFEGKCWNPEFSIEVLSMHKQRYFLTCKSSVILYQLIVWADILIQVTIIMIVCYSGSTSRSTYTRPESSFMQEFK